MRRTERTQDWVGLLPIISVMMKLQHSSETCSSPHELVMWRPAWILHASYPEDSYSTVRNWSKEHGDNVHKA